MQHLTVEELQSLGLAGNEQAIMELGRRSLKYEFCLLESDWRTPNRYCEHKNELADLEFELENSIPPSCPHCGGWITNR